ncbi:MAG: aspartyl protease family protein, partial [Bradyrhizobium sp.]
MRNIMIFAAVLVGLGTFMAQLADRLTPAQASATAAPATVGMVDSAASSQRSLSIPTDRRGHFRTEGRIDGQRVNFMV